MDRRTFNKFLALGAANALATRPTLGAQPPSSPIGPGADSFTGPHGFAHIPARAVDWPSRTYRRLLVDTHVPDWDDRLLASFDPADFVSTIAGAGFQSLMVYALSTVGLCLWRTRIGQMHRNMKGRDYFGEVMEQCHRHGLHRAAYYCLVWDDWAYKNHPDWRTLPAAGPDAELHERSGTCCINSPYSEHAIACIRELVGNYDFENIFFDMVCWSTICYCPHCIARYWKEQGAEPPRIVDWKDPQWRAFQKSRERWVREFAMSVTQAVKQVRPIHVSHQSSTLFWPWTVGISLEQNDASDFPSGDFYRGADQFSLACKLFSGLARNGLFEFTTSRTLNLSDFETTKPFQQLALESMVPMMHSSACMFIDAIKPAGTLNHRVYEFFSQINALHDAYEPFLGGEMLADVAIYYDKNSMYDPTHEGLPAGEATKNVWSAPPHLNAAVGAARFLREAHVPFGVVTNVSLDQLSGYRAVVLPGVVEMTQQQAGIFREFVRNGGILYASGTSSLSAPGDGEERFLLADVLGVKYVGKLGGRTSYLSSTDKELTDTIWPQENMGFSGPMVQAQAGPDAQVLATVTLPFVDPDVGNPINTRFAQIWSNPPAPQPGQDPGIVVNAFGKGKAVWVAAPLESRADQVNARVFHLLLSRLLQPPYQFEADTEPAVEVTLFHQGDRHRLLVGMLNLQAQVPTIPVAATLRIQVPAGRKARKVSLLPEEKEIAFSVVGSYIAFQVPSFNLVSMAMVDYA
jgi:hypothetical protein